MTRVEPLPLLPRVALAQFRLQHCLANESALTGQRCPCAAVLPRDRTCQEAAAAGAVRAPRVPAHGAVVDGSESCCAYFGQTVPEQPRAEQLLDAYGSGQFQHPGLSCVNLDALHR